MPRGTRLTDRQRECLEYYRWWTDTAGAAPKPPGALQHLERRQRDHTLYACQRRGWVARVGYTLAITDAGRAALGE